MGKITNWKLIRTTNASTIWEQRRPNGYAWFTRVQRMNPRGGVWALMIYRGESFDRPFDQAEVKRLAVYSNRITAERVANNWMRSHPGAI